jgi:hypothetical protein
LGDEALSQKAVVIGKRNVQTDEFVTQGVDCRLYVRDPYSIAAELPIAANR